MIKLAGFVPERDIKYRLWDFDRREIVWGITQYFKTIPTYHDKIMIAEEIQDEYESLHLDIEELIESPIFWKWQYSCKDEKNCPLNLKAWIALKLDNSKNRPFC
jgi:hypothetical protein